MDLLFSGQDDTEIKLIRPSVMDWIFTNKILDQIQLKSLSPNYLDNDFAFTNAEIVERITYLAISFYCYSTEIRFI